MTLNSSIVAGLVTAAIAGLLAVQYIGSEPAGTAALGDPIAHEFTAGESDSAEGWTAPTVP